MQLQLGATRIMDDYQGQPMLHFLFHCYFSCFFGNLEERDCMSRNVPLSIGKILYGSYGDTSIN